MTCSMRKKKGPNKIDQCVLNVDKDPNWITSDDSCATTHKESLDRFITTRELFTEQEIGLSAFEMVLALSRYHKVSACRISRTLIQDEKPYRMQI